MAESSTAHRRKRDWIDTDAGYTFGLDSRGADAGGQLASDETSVRWVEDQRYRRMITEATAGADIPLPSPTQRTAIPIRTSTPSSSRPTRKRPCRPNRSVPDSSGASSSARSRSGRAGPGASTTEWSSAPILDARAMQEQQELDDLLDRAARTFSLRSPATRSASAASGAMGHSGRASSSAKGVLKEDRRAVNSPGRVRMASTMDGKNGCSRDAQFVKPQAVLPHTTSEESMTSASTASSHTRLSTPSITRYPAPPPAALPPLVRMGPAPASSSQSHAHRLQPRIGLRSGSSSSTSSSSTPNAGTTHTTLSKPFKPPTIQPVRSSPRRPAPRALYASPNMAKSATATATTTATPSRLRPAAPIRKETPAARPPTTTRARIDSSPAPDEKMPSSDGAGNESFDSFDGMFASGGEDVEALLRAMDGAGA